MLAKVKRVSPKAEVLACIPNSQHWSMQTRFCAGALQYQDEGLFDRTHIRFFSRQTIIELFESAGYTLVNGIARMVEKPNEPIITAIKSMATALGLDPELVVNDALVFQWVTRAIPA
jgi:hypothetical protein